MHHLTFFNTKGNILVCVGNGTSGPTYAVRGQYCSLPGLNWERLIEEFLVEILLDVVDKDNCFTLVIKLRTAGSPHHPQNIYMHTTWINERAPSLFHAPHTSDKLLIKHDCCVERNQIRLRAILQMS